MPNPTYALSRIAELESRLAARTGKPGYVKNCEELVREIARLRGCLVVSVPGGAGASGESQESPGEVSP